GDQHEPGRADAEGPGHAHAPRGEGPAHAVRHRREVGPHARGGGPGLRGHPRAHPADRSQGAAQAAAPIAVEAAAELRRGLGPAAAGGSGPTRLLAVSAQAETAFEASLVRTRIQSRREPPSAAWSWCW